MIQPELGVVVVVVVVVVVGIGVAVVGPLAEARGSGRTVVGASPPFGALGAFRQAGRAAPNIASTSTAAAATGSGPRRARLKASAAR
jgi:hypothetical protein